MLRIVSVGALSLACLVAQQDPRGSVAGRVMDSTGAVAPGVSVRATNTETNVAASAESNAQGNFEIPFLLPGVYRVEAELAGFKKWSRGGLELRIRDRLQVDVTLEVGSVSEVVEVTAEAPVLESLTSSVSQVISSRQATDLPQRGGSLAWLYLQTPGVVQSGLPAGGPWNVDQASDVNVGGAGQSGMDYNVDGVTNNAYAGKTGFVPPPDMVQEVRVEVASYDAAVGHTTGGSINVSLKSGTNALHGTLGSWLSTNPLITRNFFTNRFIFDPRTGPVTPEKIKANTPTDRWWRYVASVGGPVLIPGVYDGRNKTFWQFGYQGHTRSQPVAQLVSVPTDAQREGDFSALLALNARYQIYDPYTTVPEGARFRRQPLPGNIIPRSRISAAAQKLVNYYPRANSPGTADFLNNYSISTPKEQIMKQPVARVDHNFSENHRMFVRYSHTHFEGWFDQYDPNSNIRGRRRGRPHRGVALDNVFVLSPQSVLDIRYGFTWFNEIQYFDNQGFNLKEFGFPDSLIGQLDSNGVTFPQIVTTGLLQLGNDGGFSQKYYTHTLLGLLTWVKGNHSVKFGSDSRLTFDNTKTYNNVSPRLDFGVNYTRGPLDNSVAAPAGQGLASLLFNIPAGGRVDLNDSRAESSGFYSLFVQDDWRLTSKLTLNLGFRWEYEAPLKERYNRTTRDFDFATPNPIQAAAQAQYARAPIAEVPASQFRTMGGVAFAGVGGVPRGLRDPDYRVFMPRFGFAYQLNPKTVLRGGFGLFYGLLGADFSDVAQPGFNQSTAVVPTLDNGVTYVATIDNPFPFGLEKPKGAAGGLSTFLGRSPGFFSSDGRRPYTQRWSFNIQFQPLSRSVVEVGYIGTRSIRLRSDSPLNAVDAKYYSRLPERDQATIDFLSATVANPFLNIPGFEGTNFFLGRNTTREQLLRPLPHFTALSTQLPAGSSWYNAFTLRFDRRFGQGFQFQANYTWSKTMEAMQYLNESDSLPTQVVANLDRPHRLVASGIYELPFGRGKRLLGNAGGVLNHIIGGWQASAIFTAQSGPPLAWGNLIYSGQFTDIALPAGDRSLERWFDTSGFDKDVRRQLGSNIRTFPLRISGVRGDGINLWDMSGFKSFVIREGMKLQVRAEAEGALNHPNFSAPNAAPTSTLFGTVNGTQEGEGARRIFIGLKLIF
ncbi:MAG: hypothetical protein FJW34_04395 [Acidobacteria bacterium]|nr:hypothetical protein [Acidobacteriota bacterium]